MSDTAGDPKPPEGATVFELDIFDQAYVDAPEPTWDQLRHLGGAWSPRCGGFHIVSRYADVVAAATDPATFTSAQGVAIPSLPIPPFLPLEVDPPDHRDYRRILNPHFSPDVAARHEPAIRQLAVDLLSAVEGLERVDLCEAFAIPFPKRVGMRLLGFPEADLAKLDNWIDHMVGESKENPATMAAALELFAYLAEYVVQRRQEPPRDDVVSALLDARHQDEPLDDGQLVPMLALLLVGGLHTTTSAVGGMLLWLADHPVERQRLRIERELIPTAVDEFLRYTSPVNQMGRTATADSDLAGCKMAKGDKLALCFGAANRDPAEFERASEVVLDRNPNRHLTFGVGPHRCVGSHFARTMVRVALEEVLDRLAEFHVPDRSLIQYMGGEARGVHRLPVVLEGP